MRSRSQVIQLRVRLLTKILFTVARINAFLLLLFFIYFFFFIKDKFSQRNCNRIRPCLQSRERGGARYLNYL